MSGCPCQDSGLVSKDSGCALEKQAAQALGKDAMTALQPVEAAVQATPLSKLKPGQTAIVRGGTLDASDAAYLRAMGVRPAALVRVCRLGHPCIIEVLSGGRECCGLGSCRIGLAKELAERVMVSDVA